MLTRLTALLLALAIPAAAQAPQPSPAPVRTKHAMVVTIHHDATDAGVDILKQGGNAIDAAVAVGFALAVVHPAAGNIGGGGFMLIRLHNGQTHFLDYREKAPAAASRDMYLDAQKNVIPNRSTDGFLSIGVPGSVAGLAYAQKHFGKLTLAQCMAPAIRLATAGFTLSDSEARSMHSSNLKPFATSARIFQRNGNFYAAGETFKQPELAATLTALAANPDDFYHGSIAKQLAAFMQKNGGLITEQDLAAYEVKERKPITGTYRGYEIITAPPPSSGGIVLVEALNILSAYDLTHLNGHPTADRSPDQIHYITEAFRRAYMDRADYLGDPDFSKLPIAEMANPKYAAEWRTSISPTMPTPSKTLVRPNGFLPPPPTSTTHTPEPTQTTHYSIVDAEGNAVATTTTINGGFGSGVTVDNLGFLLNNEMDDFVSKAGVPNMYGLIQSPNNSIAPGKRPLSAMTPTIVLKNNQLALVLGTPGGATIITTVANDIISVIDNHLTIQQAADAPRFHHQYLPDRLDFERGFPTDTVRAIAARGYIVNRDATFSDAHAGTWGDSELIAIDPLTHDLLAGHDLRRNYGKAAGY